VSVATDITGAPVSDPTDGMRLRVARFGTGIELYASGLKRWQSSEWAPTSARRFLPVSLTGTACALRCDHCATRMLEGMVTLGARRDLFATARELREHGTEGLLVSGGSGRTGAVPLEPHLGAIRRIREELGMRVVAHCGVATPQLAAGLADAGVDGVMLDIIGSRETIREVYHLDLTPADFERSLALLAERGLRVIPHIVLGLHWGRLIGEWEALEMIARQPVSALVLVVLAPLTGTPMARVAPPPLEDLSDFFALARARLPGTPVNLGCGRPPGQFKVALDRAAVDHGLNGIAYPAEGIVSYARERGLEPAFHEHCCSLTWAGL
jgi:hypothetical protein